MERSACALFGIVTYGVHMTVYEQKGDADAGVGGTDGKVPMRVWVPRRAATKPTCVCHVFLLSLHHPPHSSAVAASSHVRPDAGLSLPFIAFSRTCVKLSRYA